MIEQGVVGSGIPNLSTARLMTRRRIGVTSEGQQFTRVLAGGYQSRTMSPPSAGKRNQFQVHCALAEPGEGDRSSSRAAQQGDQSGGGDG